MADDTLCDQVAGAVCAMTTGAERTDAVMQIIDRHTAVAEGQLDDIRQWCRDWSADQWVARAILDRIGWPDGTEDVSSCTK